MAIRDMDIPEWVLEEIRYLKNGILIQEVFQWAGLAVTLAILVLSSVSPVISPYALFIVPLNYFAVARSDYLLHRNGAKILAYERCFSFTGNESLQGKVGSVIAIFDLPLFLGLAILGKLTSPYPLADVSRISVVYWILCALAIAFTWLATRFASAHGFSYQVQLPR